jgi:hypothetical protein
MRARRWRPFVGCLAAFVLLSPAQASAKGIILITWGETISHVGNTSPQADPTHGSRQVGFKYGYFGVFWIDLWTHGGTYCVYEGKRYNPISSAEAARLLGKTESELSTPFLYRIPLGWLIIGPLIVLGIILAALDKGQGDGMALLFQDPSYRKALEILKEQYSKPQAAAAPAPKSEHVKESASPLISGDGSTRNPFTLDELDVKESVSPLSSGGRLPHPLPEPQQPGHTDPAQGLGLQSLVEQEIRFRAAFEAALQHLIGVGIPREEAERNLAAMIQILTQAQPQEAPAPAGSGPA